MNDENAPSTGASAAENEPVFTGTLFLTSLLLIMIFGFWALMYLTLLSR